MKNRKRDMHGLSLWDRQRLAFIAGLLQAANEQVGPVSQWYYRGSGALTAYKRGLSRGKDAVRELLEREGF